MPHKPIRKVVIPVGPSIAYVELTQGQWSLIDSTDAEWVGRYNWFARWDNGVSAFYAYGRIARQVTSLHVAILRPQEGFLPDHISGNTLDNRRFNLREATRSQNQCNSRKRSSNTSGFKGISFSRARGVWSAHIKVNGRQLFLGRFATPEDAHAAYCKAAAEFHGEFARVA